MYKKNLFFCLILNSFSIECLFVNNSFDTSSLLEEYSLDDSLSETQKKHLSLQIFPQEKENKNMYFNNSLKTIKCIYSNKSINMIKCIGLISQTLLNILALEILLKYIKIIDICYIIVPLFLFHFQYSYKFMYKFLFRRKLIKQKLQVALANILFTILTPIINIIIISILKFYYEKEKETTTQNLVSYLKQDKMEDLGCFVFRYHYIISIFFSLILILISFAINMNINDQILKHKYRAIFKPIKELTFEQFNNIENKYLLKPISFNSICTTPMLFNYKFLIKEKNQEIDVVANQEQMDVIQNKYPFRIQIKIPEADQWRLHDILQCSYDLFFLIVTFLFLIYSANIIQDLFGKRDDLTVKLSTHSFHDLQAMLNHDFECYNQETNKFDIMLLAKKIYFWQSSQKYNLLIESYINTANNVIINICNNSWINVMKNLSFLQTCILSGEQGTGKTQMQEFTRYLFVKLEIISRLIYENDNQAIENVFLENHYSKLKKIREKQKITNPKIKSPTNFHFIYPRNIKNLSKLYDCIDYYISKYDNQKCFIIFGDDLQGVFNEESLGFFINFFRNIIYHLFGFKTTEYYLGLLKQKIQRMEDTSNKKILLYLNHIEEIIFLILQEEEKKNILSQYNQLLSEQQELKIPLHKDQIEIQNFLSRDLDKKKIIKILQEMQKSLTIDSKRLFIGQFSTNEILDLYFNPMTDRVLVQNTTTPKNIADFDLIIKNNQLIESNLYIQKENVQRAMNSLCQENQEDFLQQIQTYMIESLQKKENHFLYQFKRKDDPEEEKEIIIVKEEGDIYKFKTKNENQEILSEKVYLRLDKDHLNDKSPQIIKLLMHMQKTIGDELSPKDCISRKSFLLLMQLLKSKTMEEFIRNICLICVILKPNIYSMTVTINELNNNLKSNITYSENQDFSEYLTSKFNMINCSYEGLAGSFHISEQRSVGFDEAFLAKQYWGQENLKRIFEIFQGFIYKPKLRLNEKLASHDENI
jgi:hypothetical protein